MDSENGFSGTPVASRLNPLLVAVLKKTGMDSFHTVCPQCNEPLHDVYCPSCFSPAVSLEEATESELKSELSPSAEAARRDILRRRTRAWGVQESTEFTRLGRAACAIPYPEDDLGEDEEIDRRERD